MKQLTKSEKEAIVAAIKQGKRLTTKSSLSEAIKYSDENPKTKPHFLVATNKGHIVIY